MTGNGAGGRGGHPDPLMDVLVALREAWGPFGIAFPAGVLGLWRELQAQGLSPFTKSGEFDPVAMDRLEEAITLMRASTADIPTPHPEA